MWGETNAHVRPDRTENTWPYTRAGAFADSKCGTGAGSKLPTRADAGLEFKATQPATPTFDAGMARKSRAAARDAANTKGARNGCPELASNQSHHHGGQLGSRVRSRACLSAPLQSQGLAALCLEYARSRAQSPYGKEEALLLAQPATTALLSRTGRKTLTEQKNFPPAVELDGQGFPSMALRYLLRRHASTPGPSIRHNIRDGNRESDHLHC